MRKYGAFHRKEATFQTKADAIEQVNSGEIWGRTPRYGKCPTVQAYPGNIGERRGIEFTTDINPEPGGSPLEARWYLDDTPGVLERYNADGEQCACITADVVNYQP